MKNKLIFSLKYLAMLFISMYLISVTCSIKINKINLPFIILIKDNLLGI